MAEINLKEKLFYHSVYYCIYDCIVICSDSLMKVALIYYVVGFSFKSLSLTYSDRAQSWAGWELCTRCSHPGHPVPNFLRYSNSAYGVMVSGDVKQHCWTWTATSELRNCVKVKEAILSSLFLVQAVVMLIVLVVSVDKKQHWTWTNSN